MLYSQFVKNPKHLEKLKGWIAGSLDKEKRRYDYDKKWKKPHHNITYPNPYEQIHVPSKAVKPLTKKAKSKRLFKTRSQSKTKTKDYWKVLALSLPLVPYHVLQYKVIIDKIMKGWLWVQFNHFIDCVAKDWDTQRKINDRIVGYSSVLIYYKNSGTTMSFSNLFSLLLCNWNRFLDHI